MDEKGEHFPQKGVDCRSRVVPLTVQLTLSAGCAGNQTRNPDKCPGIRPQRGGASPSPPTAITSTALGRELPATEPLPRARDHGHQPRITVSI